MREKVEEEACANCGFIVGGDLCRHKQDQEEFVYVKVDDSDDTCENYIKEDA